MWARDVLESVAGDTGPATHPRGDVTAATAPLTCAGASHAPWQHSRNKAQRACTQSTPPLLSVSLSLSLAPTDTPLSRTHRHARAGAWGSCCCRHAPPARNCAPHLSRVHGQVSVGAGVGGAVAVSVPPAGRGACALARGPSLEACALPRGRKRRARGKRASCARGKRAREASCPQAGSTLCCLLHAHVLCYLLHAHATCCLLHAHAPVLSSRERRCRLVSAFAVGF